MDILTGIGTGYVLISAITFTIALGYLGYLGAQKLDEMIEAGKEAKQHVVRLNNKIEALENELMMKSKREPATREFVR